jgi:hypothetical protein
MDPVGLTLEHYDHVGRWRTTEAGKPVVSSGALTSVDGKDVPLAGPQELGAALAELPAVRRCFGTQTFRFLMGRDDADGDACTLVVIDQTLAQKDGDVVEAMAAVLTSDSFLYRR